jgi:hypothetical protein
MAFPFDWTEATSNWPFSAFAASSGPWTRLLFEGVADEIASPDVCREHISGLITAGETLADLMCSQF